MCARATPGQSRRRAASPADPTSARAVNAGNGRERPRPLLLPDSRCSSRSSQISQCRTRSNPQASAVQLQSSAFAGGSSSLATTTAVLVIVRGRTDASAWPAPAQQQERQRGALADARRSGDCKRFERLPSNAARSRLPGPLVGELDRPPPRRLGPTRTSASSSGSTREIGRTREQARVV